MPSEHADVLSQVLLIRLRGDHVFHGELGSSTEVIFSARAGNVFASACRRTVGVSMQWPLRDAAVRRLRSFATCRRTYDSKRAEQESTSTI